MPPEDAPTTGIALGGFMGVGKSTVARILGARLGLPVVDTDEELARRHGAIADQFRNDGEAAFRARERALLAELCDGRPRIVATGGGAWVHRPTRERLAASYRTVVLTAPLSVLRARVGGGADRPLWHGLEARLLSRQPAYADAELHVDTSSRDPEAVADAILAGLVDPGSSREVREVALGDRSYPVIVARGGFRGLGARLVTALGRRRVVIVTDSAVGPLWLAPLQAELAREGLEAEVLAIPAGEGNKTVGTWAALVDRLLRLGVDRRTPVIALGGGVTGDIVGFAAATVLRGLPVVQVPTTLLAMVDSSVGGKTAVNHPTGKNLIGAFHQPSLVWASLQTLSTLPEGERVAGLGEVLKTALLDAELLERVEAEAEALRAGSVDALAPIVARCVALKAEVVAADEREGGRRAVLNAGHTVGHAYEAALGFGRIRHGEAVALGLILEAEWAVRAGHCSDADLPDRLRRVAGRLGLPTVPPDADRPRLLAAMRVDKKTRGDMLVLPVPRQAGVVTLVDLSFAALGELVPEPA